MKKIILTTAIIFSTILGSFAEDPATPGTVARASSATADVELSVILKPIQTLVINNTGGVNLVYDSKVAYDQGVTSVQNDHLSVYSIGAFNVTVKSSDLAMGNTKPGGESIASTGILLTATKGSDNDLADLTMGTAVPLNSEATEIIRNGKGGVNKNFTITYKGEGGDAYISKYFKANGSESVYKTTVTYTIAAQ